MSVLETLTTRADAMLAEGHLAEARDLYRSALALTPRHAPALAGLGRILLAVNRPDAAVESLTVALRYAPDRVDIRADLAVAQARQGCPAAALETARSLPSTEGALGFQVDQLEILGQRDEALTLLARARVLFPTSQEMLRRQGVLFRRAGQWEDAEPCWRALVTASPEDASAWSSLGTTLAALGRDGEANTALSRATELEPEEADWWYNRAHVLIDRNQLEDALPLAERAAALAPDRPYCLTNLGVCRLGLGDAPGALEAHERAVALDPDEPEARYDLAWAQLTAGQWREGWRNHEARWRMPHFTSRRGPLAGRPWDGTPLEPGETLLLHAEQGLGDAVMMARLVPVAAARARAGAGAGAGVRVILECHGELVRLFEGLEGPDQVLARSETPPEAEAQAALMSLPHLLDLTAETIPGPVPWLPRPTPVPTPAPICPPRVGLVWRGAPDNRMDILRSCPPPALVPLLERHDIQWVSLQWGEARPPFPNLEPGLAEARDMADTGRVIAGLDLVIGVDTSVIHLAGALDMDTWVLLARVPDYRWMLDRTDSPWYPRTRLFRQTTRGDWSAPVANLVQALARRYPPGRL
ncbi:MAG: tetratricopeptide repeat protein [Rhodospirillum sp.]|nr:tetratricopeptide repeat protein [Rhodospirillum sp.]MCF8488771.1 tetratricopeptide repeat protein [Rhodospirillum sp.]MCF8499723.1 tetratricopeptide repeat protein [Rhodospirillum sp.]